MKKALRFTLIILVVLSLATAGAAVCFAGEEDYLQNDKQRSNVFSLKHPAEINRDQFHDYAKNLFSDETKQFDKYLIFRLKDGAETPDTYHINDYSFELSCSYQTSYFYFLRLKEPCRENLQLVLEDLYCLVDVWYAYPIDSFAYRSHTDLDYKSPETVMRMQEAENEKLIERDFADDSLLIETMSYADATTLSIDTFSGLGVENYRALSPSIAVLTLDSHSKQNVIDVMCRLYDYPWIKCAEPDYKLNDSDFAVGDVNGDGTRDINDVSIIQKSSVNLADLNVSEQLRADVNADGRVDITDATLLQMSIAGLHTI